MDFKKDCRTDDCETDIGIIASFDNTAVIKAPDGENNNEFVFESDKVCMGSWIYQKFNSTQELSSHII